MPRFILRLNGTGANPYHKFGLTQSPFPQIAKAQYTEACLRMQSLGGDPIPHDSFALYIRERLRGFSEEFIVGAIARFRPGEMVEIEVSWLGEL